VHDFLYAKTHTLSNEVAALLLKIGAPQAILLLSGLILYIFILFAVYIWVNFSDKISKDGDNPTTDYLHFVLENYSDLLTLIG
jgi:hypothetical protein